MKKSEKVILVTGTSSGLGQLTARTLAERGHVVYATMRAPEDRNREAAQALEGWAKSAGHRLHVRALDVTEDASVDLAVESIAREAGRVDVLVNNAGVMNVGLTEGYTLAEVQRQFDVNIYGPARTTRAVLPHMRRQGDGLIVLVSSLAGRLVFPFFGVYCASKFAAEAMAESYRYELSPLGIDSVIVEPGPFPTNLISSSPAPSDTERLEGYGELATRPAELLKGFEQFYASGDAPDPQLVADAVADLIVRPRGERPLRTVAGLDYGVRDLNTAAASVQKGLLAALGLSGLDPALEPAS